MNIKLDRMTSLVLMHFSSRNHPSWGFLVHNTIRRMLNAIPLHFFPLIKMLQQRTIPSAAKMRRYINNNPASQQDGETQRRIELNFGCLIMMEWANHSFSLTHTHFTVNASILTFIPHTHLYSSSTRYVDLLCLQSVDYSHWKTYANTGFCKNNILHFCWWIIECKLSVKLPFGKELFSPCITEVHNVFAGGCNQEPLWAPILLHRFNLCLL